jgi:hypothetical protein
MPYDGDFIKPGMAAASRSARPTLHDVRVRLFQVEVESYWQQFLKLLAMLTGTVAPTVPALPPSVTGAVPPNPAPSPTPQPVQKTLSSIL